MALAQLLRNLSCLSLQLSNCWENASKHQAADQTCSSKGLAAYSKPHRAFDTELIAVAKILDIPRGLFCIWHSRFITKAANHAWTIYTFEQCWLSPLGDVSFFSHFDLSNHNGIPRCLFSKKTHTQMIMNYSKTDMYQHIIYECPLLLCITMKSTQLSLGMIEQN